MPGLFRPPRLESERKGRFGFLWRQIPPSILFCHEDGKFNNHPASEVVIKWNFRAAMPPLSWLKKH
jgi:hypothetical protein